MGAAPGGGRRVANINVTPLVDVTLVLLIIFMVTASYITRAQIEAELPTAASGEALEKPPLVVEVREDEGIYVEATRYDLEGLAARVKLKDGKDGKAADRAIIAADKRVPYGRVTQVIDTLRLSGIKSFGLEIKPGAPPVKGSP